MNFDDRKVNSSIFLSYIEYKVKEFVYFIPLHNRKYDDNYTLLNMINDKYRSSIILKLPLTEKYFSPIIPNGNSL